MSTQKGIPDGAEVLLLEGPQPEVGGFSFEDEFGYEGEPNWEEEFEKYKFEDLAIKSIEFKNDEPIDQYGNKLSRYRLVMTDGSMRNINFCEPKERLTDIPVMETPALATGSRGFNEDGQRLLGALGIPSILVGHEGEERDPWPKEIVKFMLNPWQTFKEIRNISLARQAWVMVQVHKHFNEWALDAPSIDHKRAFLLGKSRGAMTALWFAAYSNMLDDGPDVPFEMNIATCFHDALNAENRGNTRRQPGREVFHLGRMMLNKLAGVTGDSINTMNASPKSILYELGHIPTLLRGDAGKAVPFIRRDQPIFMVGYHDDAAGQNDIWPAAFSEFENFIHRLFPGAHGAGIADKRTIALTARTFDKLVTQLQAGVDPSELDISFLRQHLKLVAAA